MKEFKPESEVLLSPPPTEIVLISEEAGKFHAFSCRKSGLEVRTTSISLLSTVAAKPDNILVNGSTLSSLPLEPSPSFQHSIFFMEHSN